MYTVFRGITHVSPMYTCYQTSVCFILLICLFATECLSQEPRKVEAKLFPHTHTTPEADALLLDLLPLALALKYKSPVHQYMFEW